MRSFLPPLPRTHFERYCWTKQRVDSLCKLSRGILRCPLTYLPFTEAEGILWRVRGPRTLPLTNTPQIFMAYM